MAKRADKKQKPAPEASHDEAPPSEVPPTEVPHETPATPDAEKPPAEASGETPTEASGETPAETPADTPAEERLAAVEAEAADLKDKLLRALAETENVRRRAERDRADASRYAAANFARELLKAADNMRRALESVSAEARGENEALENLFVGLEITEREMLSAFERTGVRPIEALGQRFDHNLHEAMFELEDPDHPAGTVVQVLETGYMLHDRLLRPSKVGVSKGGPKAESKEAPPAQPSSKTDTAKAYEKKDDPAGAKVDKEL
jgi:molecular chaperone GrpE